MGYFLLYPNMYITLVSPAGLCKKSTAMRASKEIISPIPGIEMSSDSTTRERLILDLSTAYKDGQSAMTAHSSEFGTMLTSSGMDMVVFLTDIFDCPPDWSHRTKVGGTNTIKAPFLNLLAGTTPDWMAKAMPLDTVGIGLTSRVCFIYHDTPRERDPFPTLSPAQAELKTLLTQDLAHISTLSGEYKFDTESDALFRTWYRRRSATKPADPRMSGYHERKPMHLIKMCIIIAASQRDEPVIRASDFHTALDAFTDIESRMQHVFAGVGRNHLNVEVEFLLGKMLSQPDGVSKVEIIQALRHQLRREEIDEVLDTLVMMNKAMLRNGKYYYIP
jgi:hypothetical protein